MRKPIFIGLLCTVGAGVYGLYHYQQSHEQEIRQLEAEAAAIRQTVTPLKFRITSSGDEGTTVEIHLYDLLGNDIAHWEETVPGREPTFGFAVDPLAPKQHLAFPVKLYSETVAPYQGIDLTAHYAAGDGYPRIFDHSPYDATPTARAQLIERFAAIRQGKLNGQAFGNDLYAPSFHGFRVGRIYAIEFHPYTGTPNLRETE